MVFDWWRGNPLKMTWRKYSGAWRWPIWECRLVVGHLHDLHLNYRSRFHLFSWFTWQWPTQFERSILHFACNHLVKVWKRKDLGKQKPLVPYHEYLPFQTQQLNHSTLAAQLFFWSWQVLELIDQLQDGQFAPSWPDGMGKYIGLNDTHYVQRGQVGGGFKDVFFKSLYLGKRSKIWLWHIFQMGWWKNHRLWFDHVAFWLRAFRVQSWSIFFIGSLKKPGFVSENMMDSQGSNCCYPTTRSSSRRRKPRSSRTTWKFIAINFSWS